MKLLISILISGLAPNSGTLQNVIRQNDNNVFWYQLQIHKMQIILKEMNSVLRSTIQLNNWL